MFIRMMIRKFFLTRIRLRKIILYQIFEFTKFVVLNKIFFNEIDQKLFE